MQGLIGVPECEHPVTVPQGIEVTLKVNRRIGSRVRLAHGEAKQWAAGLADPA
jgi:hypothetical protein